MTATTTIKIGEHNTRGEYIGTGINPFPSMHCFSRGANKSFLGSLEGVVVISKESFDKAQKADNSAKERFFNGNISVD